MAPLNPDLRLDNRDIAILAILSREGRIAKTELAARVNLLRAMKHGQTLLCFALGLSCVPAA